MESLENVVLGNRACNYSGIVALTFTLHDWMSTAEEEVEQIWTRPWTNLKSLYAFLRLLSVVAQLVPVIFSLQPSSDSLASISLQFCQGLVGFQGVASLMLTLAVQAILLLRVEALYQKKMRLQLVLRALYIGEIISTTVVLAIGMPEIRYGLHCVVTHMPIKFSTTCFLLPIAIEFTFFALTMIKFYEAVREGWVQQPLIFRFLQDGIWAFALPFMILFINTLCFVLLSGPYSSIAYSWLIAIPGFAGCRLILNMSHLLKRHSEGPSTYPDQNFPIDTDLHSHRYAMSSAYEMEQSIDRVTQPR